MKRLLAAGALVLTVAVAVAILVIPAMAAPKHAATTRTNAHAASHATKAPPLFTLEQRHGVKTNGPVRLDSDQFEFSCAGYGAVKGNQIISVTEGILNDADSGEAGNYWAFDKVNRSISVWNVGPSQYCIVVNYYKSTFQAIAGQTSPGMGGTLSGEEYGNFAGSAVFTVSGQLYVSDPAVWPTTGKVNGGVAIDYQCDVNGHCPGYVSFLSKYFNTSDPGFADDEPQWGWKYVGFDSGSGTKHPASAGTWVNAYTGNSGDILDSDD